MFHSDKSSSNSHEVHLGLEAAHASRQLYCSMHAFAIELCRFGHYVVLPTYMYLLVTSDFTSFNFSLTKANYPVIW